mmetsp:Transcript_25486/g.78543  ORF Transcript_25486/g.78543 Transcript_25486/m.78543 type:complete len:166 (+) Transcript_25486:182-679(+)
MRASICVFALAAYASALRPAPAGRIRAPAPSAPTRTPLVCVAPGKVQLKQKLSLKKTYSGGTDDNGGAEEKDREHSRQPTEDLEDPKMFNVMLLGDEDYSQEHVCKALLDVVEDIQIKQAEEIFMQAQKGTVANICTTSQELGEHYVQQLARKDPMIFCELKEAQ